MQITGELIKQDYKNILCKASFKGSVLKPCDLCGEEASLEIAEEISFILYNGVYNNEDNKLEDIYECMDSKIDLDEILHSELELILDDYFYCENCIRSR